MAQLLRRIIYSVATILLISSPASFQISNDLDMDNLEKHINNITGLENIDFSKFSNSEDFEQLFREKCQKNGASEEAITALKDLPAEIQACIEKQVNISQLQDEITVAKKTGSMDEVFGKYCKKYPELHACFEDSIDKARSCLDTNEQNSFNDTLVILDKLKEFMCFKDGDRLAMFVAEGGIECLESKKDELNDYCLNKTSSASMLTDLSPNNLPSLLFTERECNDFDKIRICVNEALETCKDSTPANIVDAFFKFLKKQLPCEKTAANRIGNDSSNVNNVAISSFVLLVSVTILKFL